MQPPVVIASSTVVAQHIYLSITSALAGIHYDFDTLNMYTLKQQGQKKTITPLMTKVLKQHGNEALVGDQQGETAGPEDEPRQLHDQPEQEGAATSAK